MGVRLMQYFDRPYASVSISEFWRRWHISLSSWFRDYLYISLGGNRVAKWRWQMNLMITFLVSGLWHGANWTFVAWGALHGFYLVFSIWTAGIRGRLVRIFGLDRRPVVHRALSTATIFALVCFAWIFFRATSIHDALYIARHLFAAPFLPDGGLRGLFDMELDGFEFTIALIAIAILEFGQRLQQGRNIRKELATRPLLVRWAAYYALVIGILVFGVFSHQEFIYFQF
jgi:D-alanyl-lipoteichoic acid acyltransferase DltB (MBOAT superfamily)